VLSHPARVLDARVKRAFALMLYARFLSLLSPPWDTCVTFLQMCRPSQTPHLTLSGTWLAPAARLPAKGAAAVA